MPVRRPIRASRLDHRRRTGVHLAGELGAAAQHVAAGRGWCAGRRGRRRPPPWRRRGRSTPSPRPPCARRSAAASGGRRAAAPSPDSGKRTNAGHHVKPATSHSGPAAMSGAHRHPDALPEQRADLVGVVVDRGRAPRRRPARSAPRAAGPSRRRAGRRAAGPRRGRRARPTACGRHVSRRAAPTTHSASSRTRPAVGCSASRPATTEPDDVPIAPNSEQASATPANGVRMRRQSTGTRPSRHARRRGARARRRVGARSVVVTVLRRYGGPPTSVPLDFRRGSAQAGRGRRRAPRSTSRSRNS